MSEFQSLKELRKTMPAPRRSGRDDARAALMERARCERAAQTRRHRRRRTLSFGALAGAAAASVTLFLLLSASTSSGPGVHAEVASAAELGRIGRQFPRLQIAGPWQIISTEGTGDHGRVHFRWEDEVEPFGPDQPVARVELRWHSSFQDVREAELLAKGYTFDSAEWLKIRRPSASGPLTFRYTPTHFTVFLPPLGPYRGDTVVLWSEAARTFELRASCSVYQAYMLAERIEVLNAEQWQVALKPGGGPYLAETIGGVTMVERVKVGMNPDGSPIYETRGWIAGPESGKRLLVPDLTAPTPPTIYREGDEIRIVVHRAPQ